jgi:acetolactate synthase-1/2/3 large subunit
MNGAESLMRTMEGAGAEVCFANPGTTELALVAALDAVPRIRAVLGLFEGVCSGAADGYARMTGRPALALFHLGPGFANAIANLHNARRARSPVVSLVGDHATWHRAADAPLASDIESLARPVSRWVRTSTSAAGLARDAAEAVAAAAPGGVATLILPSDCQGEPGSGPAPAPAARAAPSVPAERIERVAAALRQGRPGALFLGGRALQERGQRAAARVAARTGCRVVAECFPARVERGAGMPRLERIPYFPERAIAFLEGLQQLVLAGAPEPVSFFGYPGVPSRLVPGASRIDLLAEPEEDVERALEELADALDAPAAGPGPASSRPPPDAPQGRLTPEVVGAVLALCQPEGAIVVDESATTGLAYFYPAAGSPRHTLLTLTGGSIGMGPACAVGAAVACPDRPVLSFQGDGGAMYTLQSLWTQAREQLHVVTLICANRSYRVLQVELERAGIPQPGPQARSLTDLSGPAIDWVLLARGMGVPATRVDEAEGLRRELARAVAEPGPHLVEMLL